MKKNFKKKVRALEGNLFDVLKFIYEFKAQHDYSPSIREMCAAIKTPMGVELSSSVCRYDLVSLRDMGYIHFLPREARTVHLTPLGKAFMQAHTLPERVNNKRSHVAALLQEVEELLPA